MLLQPLSLNDEGFLLLILRNCLVPVHDLEYISLLMAMMNRCPCNDYFYYEDEILQFLGEFIR